MIYLDNNGSTRVFERVADAMHQFVMTRYANPGSAYGTANGLDEVIARAKSSVGTVLGVADPSQWVLTSGATESNNLAIAGAARCNPNRRHIVISNIEHPSVTETARYLERRGYRLTLVPVDRNGVVDPSAVVSALASDTLLVSVMAANNETGVVQAVDEIANQVKRFDSQILVHTDATQAIGKVPIDLGEGHRAVDLLSLTAHKIHGPKGTGALFVRNLGRLAPILFGGAQQQGLRPGTENPAGAVGLAMAIELVVARSLHYRAIAQLRDALEIRLKHIAPGALVLGAFANRLPTTSCVCLPGRRGSDVVKALANLDIAVASASACQHGGDAASAVAMAMGLDPVQASSCIRISLSLETTAAEIDDFLQSLTRVIRADRVSDVAVGALGR